MDSQSPERREVFILRRLNSVLYVRSYEFSFVSSRTRKCLSLVPPSSSFKLSRTAPSLYLLIPPLKNRGTTPSNGMFCSSPLPFSRCGFSTSWIPVLANAAFFSIKHLSPIFVHYSRCCFISAAPSLLLRRQRSQRSSVLRPPSPHGRLRSSERHPCFCSVSWPSFSVLSYAGIALKLLVTFSLLIWPSSQITSLSRRDYMAMSGIHLTPAASSSFSGSLSHISQEEAGWQSVDPWHGLAERKSDLSFGRLGGCGYLVLLSIGPLQRMSSWGRCSTRNGMIMQSMSRGGSSLVWFEGPVSLKRFCMRSSRTHLLAGLDIHPSL